MLTIEPLSAHPEARAACIGWSAAEWAEASGFQQSDFAAEFDRILDDPVDEMFVALADGRPVGMACLLEQDAVPGFEHHSPWLSTVVVAPEARRKGIAAALIAHVERYAAMGGDDRLFLATGTPGLYVAQGWEVMDIARHGSGDVFVMTKGIAA